MTLTVPLSIRVGSKHITRQVDAIEIRREAIGGVRYVKSRLKQPLDRFDPNLDPFQPCAVYDGRSAEIVATGRLADPGRGSGTDGQTWDLTMFGPWIFTTDQEFPYVVVDRSVSDGWRRVENVTKGGTDSISTHPDDTNDNAPEGILLQFPQGLAVTTNSRVILRYERIREAGQKIFSVSFTRDAGITDANYSHQAITRVDGGATADTAINATFNTAAASASAVVGGTITNGRNTVDLRIIRTAGGATTVANDDTWGFFHTVAVRALLVNADGTDYIPAFSNTVLAHEVVNDLLGRVLTQFGTNAVVDTSGAYPIEQMAYPDGVTAEQVLNDLMAMESAFRWYFDDAGIFHWEPWPTTVRYEATLAAGGDFPASTQEVYNEVNVRWRSPAGLTKTTSRTMACDVLDDAGITRAKLLDLSDEISSQTAAEEAGDGFLADHNVPKNAGTLNVRQRIRDLATGRMIDPSAIQPGELIRIRGVESYPDALNASSNDGLTVFRIWSSTYRSTDGSADLELDAPSRTVSNAIADLQTRRNRKR